VPCPFEHDGENVYNAFFVIYEENFCHDYLP
jgi:hypothetical protein